MRQRLRGSQVVAQKHSSDKMCTAASSGPKRRIDLATAFGRVGWRLLFSSKPLWMAAVVLFSFFVVTSNQEAMQGINFAARLVAHGSDREIALWRNTDPNEPVNILSFPHTPGIRGRHTPCTDNECELTARSAENLLTLYNEMALAAASLSFVRPHLPLLPSVMHSEADTARALALARHHCKAMTEKRSMLEPLSNCRLSLLPCLLGLAATFFLLVQVFGLLQVAGLLLEDSLRSRTFSLLHYAGLWALVGALLLSYALFASASSFFAA